MAEFYAGCATAEEMLLARDVLMFFGCRVEASLHMDSAAARGICRREGVGKVKSLEVRTLWLQQVVKAKTLTLKTVKSQDNCADLGTKTLTAGTLSLLRNLNGLVDKNTMDNVSCGVQSITISPGESRMLRATALEVLERTLDEIARNNRVTSRSEKMMRGLEPGRCTLLHLVASGIRRVAIHELLLAQYRPTARLIPPPRSLSITTVLLTTTPQLLSSSLVLRALPPLVTYLSSPLGIRFTMSLTLSMGVTFIVIVLDPSILMKIWTVLQLFLPSSSRLSSTVLPSIFLRTSTQSVTSSTTFFSFLFYWGSASAALHLSDAAVLHLSGAAALASFFASSVCLLVLAVALAVAVGFHLPLSCLRLARKSNSAQTHLSLRSDSCPTTTKCSARISLGIQLQSCPRSFQCAVQEKSRRSVRRYTPRFFSEKKDAFRKGRPTALDLV